MRIADLAAGAAIAGLGIFLLREGADLGFGERTEPGSGFMFWWIGVAMMIAAAALAGTGVLAPARPAAAEASIHGNWRLPLVCIIGLVAYAIALQPLGFIPTSALLLTALFAIVGGYRLPVAAGVGTGAAVACWFLFAKLLSSNLPAGILAGTILGS